VEFLVKLAEVEEADARAEANFEHSLPACELLEAKLDAPLIHTANDRQAVKLDRILFIHADVTLEWQQLQANFLAGRFHVGSASIRFSKFPGFHFILSPYGVHRASALGRFLFCFRLSPDQPKILITGLTLIET